ncbi:unnamed protein product [Ilex paraguariensis]|uniref:C3H1-type domain-containing protein n=1 Tax=Ilex paraguariensis TaxID=185542 RepID=A0ABC8RSI6_9AQUA
MHESIIHESISPGTELDMKKRLHPQLNAAEHRPVKAVGNLTCSKSSRLVEEGKGPDLFPNRDCSTIGRSFCEVDGSVTNPAGAAESPVDISMERSLVIPHEDLSQSKVSVPASGINSEDQFVKGFSPFRLIQDYASDESSENDDELRPQDVSLVAVSPSLRAGPTSFYTDVGHDFQKDLGSKSLPEVETGFGRVSEFVLACSLNKPSESMDSSVKFTRDVKEIYTSSPVTRKAEEFVGNSDRNQESTNDDGNLKKNALGLDAVPASGKPQKEDAKVDEFGRLVREGASDTDSDDSYYTRRRGKRGRSWSRSRSPHDRRRRSPWRRNDKRSRSRSWSPKKRRSRSRSPFRRGVEVGGDKMRRDKGQLPDCFDFRRGKCYRGASCRFRHNDSDRSEGSRWYKSKRQYQEALPRSKISDFHEETQTIPPKKSVCEHDQVKNKEMQLVQDTTGGSWSPSKDMNTNEEKMGVSGRTCGGEDGESLVTAMDESVGPREIPAQGLQMEDIKEEHVEPTSGLPDDKSCLEVRETIPLIHNFPALVTDADAKKLPGDSSHAVQEKLGFQQPQTHLSDLVLQNSDHQPQHMGESSISDSSVVQTSSAIPNQLPIKGFNPNQISSIQSDREMNFVSNKPFSSESLAPKELSSLIPHLPSHLPPPIPSDTQGITRDYNLMPPTVTFSFQSSSMENYPPYQPPLPYQYSHFPMPESSARSSLPPPPPLLLPPPPPPPLLLPPPPPPPRPPYVNEATLNAAIAPHGGSSLQSQQNLLPTRNDLSSHTFVRPHPTELPAHSQVGEFQHRIYPAAQEPDRPLSHLEDFRQRTLPVSNPLSQSSGGPCLGGEDRFRQLPVQGLIPSSSFSQGNIHPESVAFFRESPTRRMQSFPAENLPPGDLLTPSSQSNPYLQEPFYGLQRPAPDSVSMHLGEPGMINSKMLRYTSDFPDRNQPSLVSNFGVSRISNHYNPYASTFDKPLSSKFSSNVINLEKDMPMPYGHKYGASFSLNHVPLDGQGVGSFGSRNMASSPNSARAVEQILPRSGGDQYDPLFDSIEPSSNSFRKADHDQKRETTDESDMLRLSGSNKPLDVGETNKKREAGAVVITVSLDNDEYGETADAEVGAVENGSPSDPTDVENTAAGEIEIDQVKTPGKSKKSKDSRSMRLFKSVLANFVKEVLKPSWRQGNMSKEAFKTIVKKTVDKVSGAMKSHQVPKSKAKIDQYIDSSQRKLTKLVMGYVDKYVKV